MKGNVFSQMNEDIIELHTLDYAPERDRLYRMRDAAPAMYEMLDKLVEAIDSVDTVNGLFPFGVVKIRSELVKDAKALLERIDGEEER